MAGGTDGDDRVERLDGIARIGVTRDLERERLVVVAPDIEQILDFKFFENFESRRWVSAT